MQCGSLSCRAFVLILGTASALVAAPAVVSLPYARADGLMTDTWTQRSPATSPSARIFSAMAYDAARGETVLFGGGGTLGDTWTWNGTTWTQHFPATSPPARSLAAMAYDAARGETVLFGGDGGGGAIVLLADTWTWNGTTWTQHFLATSPSARREAVMAYDTIRDETILFGGKNESVLGDTWTWNGTIWTQHSPATSPSARYQTAMTYDTARGETVLFGGFDSQVIYLGDTWAWNGTTWTQHFPVTSPPARSRATMVYDTTRHQPVLFGGGGLIKNFNDTWTYDTTGYPSDACAAGAVVADGFAGSAYVRIRTVTADARTTWVCVRADGPSISYGGKFTVANPSATLPAPPTTDTASSACTSTPGNAIPGQHPIQAGSIGDPAEPATYVPFLLDAHATTSEAWVCVGVGTVQRRIVVPAPAGATAPTVVFTPDPPGSQTPSAPTAITPSGSCQSGGGETGRLLNTTVADARAFFYTWQPAASILKLCVRAEGVVSAGGVLTVDATAAGGVPSSIATSTTDLTPCTLSVIKLDTPGIEVRRSAGTATPASVCLVIGTSALRVTVDADNGQPPATVSWTPDPGTP